MNLVNGGNWVLAFLDPVSAILNCRLLLDLYETKKRSEDGGSSVFDLGSGIRFAPIEGTDAPEDSSFLNSFSGGVLHSFPDDDMELDMANDEPSEAGLCIPLQTMMSAAEGSDAVAGGSGGAGGSAMVV
ncbi:hypothetical protein C2E23DRAFT_885217 [Lenzites betulinus]|nr:hypothetical protein C2E23DRAFT_885217 [Lenzites betulinus]